MITALVALAVLALAVALVARYGADSRSTTGDPTGRDPAWPSAPARDHTPAGDARRSARWLAAVARRAAAHQRAWEAYDGSLREWSAPRVRGLSG